MNPKPQHTFVVNISMGTTSPDVLALQQCLNYDPDTQVSQTCAGSPGQETNMFGSLTLAAVKKFQHKYAVPETGFVGPLTRKQLNKIFGQPYTLEQAIVQVESEGYLNAVGDENLTNHAYGPMQIRQGVCDDVNQKFGTKYQAIEMLGNLSLSMDYFDKYMQIYCPNGTNEQKSRTWNGGSGWVANPAATDGYWTKVHSYLE